MSDINPLTLAQRNFIQPYLPTYTTDDDADIKGRPFTLLTWAQSQDSMIAIEPGVRTAISGPESKAMTHYLRKHFDAILVGGGTARADNPGLNSRYENVTLASQPQPIILSNRMPDGWLEGSKVMELAGEGRGHRPIHVRLLPANKAWYEGVSGQGKGYWERKGDHLDVNVPADSDDAWKCILQALHGQGIKSIMIEGGAQVINTLLEHSELVDKVVVTTGPIWLGRGGVNVGPAPINFEEKPVPTARLQGVQYLQFGADMVMAGEPKGWKR